jgi:predicted component of type VI protein secretion system
VTADHGKEARFPYLAEDVVALLHLLPADVVRFADAQGAFSDSYQRLRSHTLAAFRGTQPSV